MSIFQSQQLKITAMRVRRRFVAFNFACLFKGQKLPTPIVVSISNLVWDLF